jgi:hypothetical protein
MKTKFLIFISLSVIIISSLSCKKETPEGYDRGWMKCQIDGMPWEGIAWSDKNSPNSIPMIHISAVKGSYKGKDFIPETLISISYIRETLGQQNVSRNPLINPRALFTKLDGAFDFSCQTFEVDTTNQTENWIEIVSEQDSFGFIKGKFNLVLESNGGCYNSEPSTIEITNGTFEIRVDEE